MNTITSTVDKAVVAMVERTGMFFSCNVPNLVCYNFRNFQGSVSILVDGRYITRITARVDVPNSDKGEYDWCCAAFKPNNRPCVLDKEWMRDMFKAINEIARGNVSTWEEMGEGFNRVELAQVPLQFR